MKINSRYIIISAIEMILLLVPGILAAQRAVEQGQKIMQPMAADKVYFSSMPQTVAFQNGHIIIGFMANKSEDSLHLTNPLSNMFCFVVNSLK